MLLPFDRQNLRYAVIERTCAIASSRFSIPKGGKGRDCDPASLDWKQHHTDLDFCRISANIRRSSLSKLLCPHEELRTASSLFESCWQDRRQQRLHATNLRSVLTDSVFDLWSPKSWMWTGYRRLSGSIFQMVWPLTGCFFWGVDSIFLESCTKELISLTTSQTPDSSGIIYCQRQKDCEALLRVDLQKRQRWHESMTDGNDWKGFAACC